MCRSRRELSNAYLLSNFGFDRAENEPAKVCPIERCWPGGGWQAAAQETTARSRDHRRAEALAQHRRGRLKRRCVRHLGRDVERCLPVDKIRSYHSWGQGVSSLYFFRSCAAFICENSTMKIQKPLHTAFTLYVLSTLSSD